MIKITPEQIAEIAGELETGLHCYLNTKTGELIFVPDEDLTDDVKPWKEALEKLENDFNFQQIEKPGSRDQFTIMEDFVLGLPDGKLKQALLDVLDDEKPFRNFKKFIDRSDVRNEWFAFNSKKLQEWVAEEVRTILERSGDGN